MKRLSDVCSIESPFVEVDVDGKQYFAAPGETILSTLLANNVKTVSANDHDKVSGSYCGMGVCFCCLVTVDGVFKQRACQTVIAPGMKIMTSNERLVDKLKVVDHE